MQKAFTKSEQLKLLEHPNIIYAGVKVVKFDDELLNHISVQCSNLNDIRTALRTYNVPHNLITQSRVKALYIRYVSKGSSDRINMPRKYFTIEEIDQLIRLEVVKKVTTSTITYTTDFKVKIANCKNLTEARQLMIDNHVPLEVIGKRRFENSYYQLRNQMNKKVMQLFQVSRCEKLLVKIKHHQIYYNVTSLQVLHCKRF